MSKNIEACRDSSVQSDDGMRQKVQYEAKCGGGMSHNPTIKEVGRVYACYRRAERAYLVVQLAQFFVILYIMYPTMHFGPETAPALRANVTSLATSARHQCIAFN